MASFLYGHVGEKGKPVVSQVGQTSALSTRGLRQSCCRLPRVSSSPQQLAEYCISLNSLNFPNSLNSLNFPNSLNPRPKRELGVSRLRVSDASASRNPERELPNLETLM